jgi:hypothetical protein
MIIILIATIVEISNIIRLLLFIKLISTMEHYYLHVFAAVKVFVNIFGRDHTI